MKFNEGFLAQMREAAQLLQSEGPMAATAAIQKALQGQGNEADVGRDAGGYGAQATHARGARPASGGIGEKWRGRVARQPVEDADVIDLPAGNNTGLGGRFVSATCNGPAGSRGYKLYIPSGYKDQALPLVVMLHGCTQNPDDFAAGTGMNRLAEEHNFLVAYPAQSKGANPNVCWNWFERGHQQRGRGEPAVLAAITREIGQKYRVDDSRVYIAGLSAGGAMAAVMAAQYPEVFAAVGIHSGLPYGVAQDMPSAFAAMKRRKARGMAAPAQSGAPALSRPVPVIVFHGDRDTTVHPDNGEQAMLQCLAAKAGQQGRTEVQEGRAPEGRRYTRTVVHDAQCRPVAEKWIVHGAGHAWSGGDRSGSYTDPEGPSAAREMLRFFRQHRRAPLQ